MNERLRTVATHPRLLVWNPAERRLRSAWRIGLCVALFLGLFVALDVVASAVLGDRYSITLQSVAFLAAAVGAVWAVARVLDRRPLREVGFDVRRESALDLAFGAVLGLLVPTAVFAIAYLAGWVVTIERGVSSPRSMAVLLGVSLVGIAAFAIAEEVVIRGYVLKNLLEGLRLLPSGLVVPGAVLGSAVIFAAFHNFAHWYEGLHYVVAGVLLAIPVVLRGELAMAVGIHTMFNFGQAAVFGFHGTGAIATVTVDGPAALTGPANLLYTVAVACAIGVVAWWISWREDGGFTLRYLEDVVDS